MGSSATTSRGRHGCAVTPRARIRSRGARSAVDAVRRSLYPGGEHTFVPSLDPSEEPTVLPARQQEIWNYLVEYVDRHGYPPTVREIGEEVGLASPSTVHAHLANLERAGLLRRDPTKPRALELSGRGRAAQPEVRTLPLLGQELLAILRGASLECPICGEFLLHGPEGEISCPECGSRLAVAVAATTRN